MKTVVAYICLFVLASAACSADDKLCEDPIAFNGSSQEFYITKYYPTYGMENVPLDATLHLEFSDAIPRSQGFDGFFYLLDQYTGVSTKIPATCINTVSSNVLEFSVVDCMNDVLKENTVYVFYISQRINGNTVETLSSIKGIEVNEKAFGLEHKSVMFKTVSHIAAEVVPAKCNPSFGQNHVALKPYITIAFSSKIHMGTGKITIRSVNHHPTASVTVDVKDAKHVVLEADHQSISIFDITLMGNEQYKVVFDAGIVLSESGSKCGTTNEFVFTTTLDLIKPHVTIISPRNYKRNLPTNLQIRIAFSKNILPHSGLIIFKNEKQDITVNVQSESEVQCKKDVCTIQPLNGFIEGSYDMSFNEFTFVDYSGNTLEAGVMSHTFSIIDTKCGLDYVNVDENEKCYCQSVNNQCQCQCGETYFVKDY